MGNILIAGFDGLLAGELAGRFLAGSENHVFCLMDEGRSAENDAVFSLVSRVSGRQKAGGAAFSEQTLRERFTMAPLKADESDPGLRNVSEAEEIWFLEGEDTADILDRRNPVEAVRAAVSLLSRCGGRVFNYVDSIYSREDGESSGEQRAIHQEVEERCRANGIGYRFFHVSSIISDEYIRAGSGGRDIRQLLAALDDLTAEIQGRMPEYFDFQALRLSARPDAAVNLIRLEHAADIMTRLAVRESTLGAHHFIGSPRNTPLKSIARMLGKLYGISLTPISDQRQLNAIDRLLERRFTATGEAFGADASAWQDSATPAGIAPDSLLTDDQSLQKIFTAIRQQQKLDRSVSYERARKLPGTLPWRTIEKKGGALNYFVAGAEGEYVLILSALGQGLEFWFRLIDRLMRRYRVILWEPRGLEAQGDPVLTVDQVDDIESILEREQIAACHLIGWCTGPQVAAEFFLRRPEAVLSMAFLNSVFKFRDRPELETPYSNNLEKLCRVMSLRPEMAPSVMRSLSAPPAIDINLMDETDSHTAATQVLALITVDLRSIVLAPFRNVSTTLNYAQQIVDLQACRTLEHAARVDAPILIVGCECDTVASAAKSREAARRFPRCIYVELPGATHYSIYDRPASVAAMLQRFFHDPRGATETEQQPMAAAHP